MLHKSRLSKIKFPALLALSMTALLFLNNTKIDAQLAYTLGYIEPKCFNGMDGKIWVHVTTGNPSYRYLLFDRDPLLPGAVLYETIGPVASDSISFAYGCRALTYYVVVQENFPSGASGFEPITLTQPTAMGNVTFTVMEALTCYDGSDASIRANMNGGTTPYTYQWSANTGNQTTQTAINLGRGTYSVTIRDANGCGGGSQVGTIFFITHDSIPPQLRITSVASTNSCQGFNNGTITLTGTGGTGTRTFAIVTTTGTDSTTNITGVFNNLAPATYKTYVIDSRGCIDTDVNLTISDVAAPTANAGGDTSRCSANPLAALLMTGATAGGTYSTVTWSGGVGSGNWAQNANPALASFTPTMTSSSIVATLTVTGSGVCLGHDATDSKNIAWSQTPVVDAGTNISNCTLTPLAAINMTGATATGTYSANAWTGGGGQGTWTQNANPASATFTPTVTSGSFTATLTLTGGGSCTGTNPTDTRTITWGPRPTVNAGNDTSRCSATPLAAIVMTGATASGSYSANLWNGGAGFGTWTQNANPALAVFTPTATSGSFTATLTLTGNGACIGTNPTDTRVITWGQTPTVDAGADNSICSATPLNPILMTGAIATGSYSANAWSGGGGLGNWTQNANPALATFTPTTSSGSFTATLTLTGNGACVGNNPSDTKTITWGQLPAVDAGSNSTLCVANPLTPIVMTGATATGAYSANNWTGGGGLGTWIQNANPALAAFTPTTSSGSFTATLTLTGSGTCLGSNPSDTKTISWGQTPTINAGNDTSRCSATPLTAIVMTGATASGTYSAANWTGGGGLGTWTQNANPALASFTPTTTYGTFTATVTLTGSNGCAGTNPSDTRIITWGQTPTVDAGLNLNRCDAFPLLPFNMTGATALGSYSGNSWSGGAGLGTWTQNANPALALFTPTTTSGSFTATLTLTGSYGCTGTNPSDTRTINWGQTPTVDAGPDIARCSGTPLTPINMAGAATSGTFGANTWTGGGGLGTWTQNANPALATFTPTTASGSFTATLTLTGSGTCAGTNPSDTRVVSWGQTPTVDAGPNSTICAPNPLNPIPMTGATASGSYSGNAWTGGAALGAWVQNANPALATFTPTTTSGSFTATLALTGSGACSGTNPSDTKTISWGQTPAVNAGNDTSRCSATPLAAILMTGATASGTYSINTWSGGAALGTWTQNANPALAIFTPTTISGSFTATLTLNGSGACTGSNISDTRIISWGQIPTVDAGTDISRCNATPLTAIPMTGAVASGSYSANTWTGGGGLGTWTQNANPALASFTPTTTSGSFTATLTLTGSGTCVGNNPSDTRIISWGQTPAVDAGLDLSRCDATPLAAINMTGATASGTYSGNTWSGGTGQGTWTQNADPALASFTPTTMSGSFTATLTLTGTGACLGSNISDIRIISWGQTPTVNAGNDTSRCSATPLAAILMTGAITTGTYGTATWSGGVGFGTWTQNANPALASFTPTTATGSFTATLTLTGSGSCTGTNPTDTKIISWGQIPTVNAGNDTSRCSATPLDAVMMTGATASGSFSAATWTGGGGLGAWIQNANPALASFTPTTPSGSFTATLTITGSGTCTGTNPTDTRTITWGQVPTLNAGSDIILCNNTPLDPILMNGATASGSFSSNTWTGEAGLGTWVQNADPALATFTPTTTSGSFTATLTITGSGSCTGNNPADTRIISWGQQLAVDAGLPITRCDNNPLALVNMTGASASGSYSAATWTGGAGLGTWTQNADPALAIFTPTANSGSFIATLTLTGSAGCAGTNPADTRTISWGRAPISDAGPDAAICHDGSFMVPSADTSFSTNILWTTSGDGLFDNNSLINPTYTPGTLDLAAGSVVLYLEAFGNAPCSSVTDSLILTIPPLLEASIGTVAPFFIGPNTEINVCFTTSGHTVVQDMGYYLVAPNGTTVVKLKAAPMEYDFFGMCNFDSPGDVNDLCFTTEGTDTLDVCSELVPLTGDFEITGNWNDIYGMNPAAGGWAVMVKDTAQNMGGTDGTLVHASITFADTAIATGLLKTLTFESGVINIPIEEPTTTKYIIPGELSTTCFNTCDAIATVTVIGGTPPYVSYAWSGPTAVPPTDSVVLCPGNYTVTVTDAAGCQAIAAITVVAPDSILLDAITYSDTLSCNGGSTDLIVDAHGGTGPLQYTYDGVTYIAVGDTFHNVPAGSYTVIIADASGCSIIQPITIIEPASNISLVDVELGNVSCYGASDGYIGILVTGGTTPYTYSLRNGAVVQEVIVSNDSALFDSLSGGNNYSVTVTDLNNCETFFYPSPGTIVITEPSPFILDSLSTTSVLCAEDSSILHIYVTGGQAPYSYSVNSSAWGAFTEGVDILVPAGSDTLRIMDSRGCMLPGDTVLDIYKPPTIVIDNITVVTPVLCYGDTTTIDVDASGGVGVLEYSLDGITYNTDGIFSGISSSSSIFIRDTRGCNKEFPSTIPGPAQLLFDSIVITNVVNGLDGSIDIYVSGGAPGYLYQLDASGFTGQSSYTGLDTGYYHVYAQDANGCAIDSIIHVGSLVLSVDVTVIAGPSCPGLTDGSITVMAQNGTPPYRFSIYRQSDAALIDYSGLIASNTYTFDSLEAGVVYLILVMDADDKEVYRTVFLDNPDPIDIDVSIVTPDDCDEWLTGTLGAGSALADATGGYGNYSYLWSGSADTTQTATGIHSGANTVTVTDIRGCSEDTSYTMTFNSANIVTLVIDTIFYGCYGFDLTLEADSLTNANEYAWILLPGIDVVGSGDSYTVDNITETSQYSFMAYNGIGCSKHEIITATYYERIISDLQRVDTFMDGLDVLVLDPKIDTLLYDDASFQWSDNGNNGDVFLDDYTSPNPEFRNPGGYDSVDLYLTVTTLVGGCEEYDTTTIGISKLPLNLDDIPNAFSPNGDGTNDTWDIGVYGGADIDLNIAVYNKWGSKVYESVGDYTPWDGTHNGKEVATGTYYFVINFKYEGNQTNLNGPLLIVR